MVSLSTEVMQSPFCVLKDFSRPRGLWVSRKVPFVSDLAVEQISNRDASVAVSSSDYSFKGQNGKVKQLDCLKQIFSFRGMITRFGAL